MLILSCFIKIVIISAFPFSAARCNSQTINHNELGALTNNFMFMKNKAVPCDHKVKLIPQLPTESKDTGKWSWNTGETTKDITVTTDKSYVYRVTYTNEYNVKKLSIFFNSCC